MFHSFSLQRHNFISKNQTDALSDHHQHNLFSEFRKNKKQKRATLEKTIIKVAKEGKRKIEKEVLTVETIVFRILKRISRKFPTE